MISVYDGKACDVGMLIFSPFLLLFWLPDYLPFHCNLSLQTTDNTARSTKRFAFRLSPMNSLALSRLKSCLGMKGISVLAEYVHVNDYQATITPYVTTLTSSSCMRFHIGFVSSSFVFFLVFAMLLYCLSFLGQLLQHP